MGSHRLRRRRRPLRAVLLGLGVLVLLVLAAVGVLAWQALQARDHLLAAVPAVQTLEQQLADGAGEDAASTLRDLQADTAAARDNTDGPLWAAAALLPVVGDDASVVTATAAIVDDVAQKALPPAVEAAGALDPAALQPDGGKIDLAPIQAAAPQLETAAAETSDAAERAAALDLAGVHPRIAGPVGDLTSQLTDAASTAATVSKAATLLPGMLGADGPRSYLLLFQNNAELRATGGIPGAFAVVTADRGAISLTGQGSARDVGVFDEPVLPLSTQELGIYTERLGIYLQDVNLTPHFPRSAELAREMYRRSSGQEVSGVLSVDPIALSYLLRATGPVPLPGGEQLSADNAVDLLLSDVYRRFEDPQQQDLFFASAAASVFTALTSGSAEPQELLDALATAAGERRLLVWSSVESEQALLADTQLAGTLSDEQQTSPLVSVSLNDATGSKMDYYLKDEVSATATCGGNDRLYEVSVTLTNTAPADAARSLPRYVTGGGAFGVPEGTISTQVIFHGPVGAGVAGLTQDGAPIEFLPHLDRGRPVGLTVANVEPGASTTLTATFVGDVEQAGPVRVRTTPGVHTIVTKTPLPPCG